MNKEYKKIDPGVVKNITKDDKKVAAKLDLDDRIYVTSDRQCFITIKDHKLNYINNPTCRLLNPTKSEIGKISKQKLEKIISITRKRSNLNQWKNATYAITWFKNINNKARFSFIQFDIWVNSSRRLMPIINCRGFS